MTATTPTDGRTVRRDRNRSNVVEAMLELIDSGMLDPTVEQVVARSGISERSIFRYFDGLNDLRGAVIRRNFERVEPLLVIVDIGQGMLWERIVRFVETRLRICETVAGLGRISRMTAPFEPLVAAERERFRRLLCEQVRVHFAPEFAALSQADAADVEVLVEVIVSFDAWDQLTSAFGRSRLQIRRAWIRGLSALLGATMR